MIDADRFCSRVEDHLATHLPEGYRMREVRFGDLFTRLFSIARQHRVRATSSSRWVYFQTVDLDDPHLKQNESQCVTVADH